MFAKLNKNQLRFLMLCVIWGSTWIGTKAGINVVPPLFFAGTRFTAAGAENAGEKVHHGSGLSVGSGTVVERRSVV